MSKFLEQETIFSGLFTVTKKIMGDNRGYLERLYCMNELRCWNNRPIAQVNHTYTKNKGTIRGLHFQHHPYSEAKFICCLRGKVMDVALDLRTDSTTYGQFYIIQLTAEKHNAILIPEGFAHGFQTLTNDVEMLYFHSQCYSPAAEGGVNAFDQRLNVPWALPCTQMSERDKLFPSFQHLGDLPK